MLIVDDDDDCHDDDDDGGEDDGGNDDHDDDHDSADVVSILPPHPPPPLGLSASCRSVSTPLAHALLKAVSQSISPPPKSCDGINNSLLSRRSL